MVNPKYRKRFKLFMGILLLTALVPLASLAADAANEATYQRKFQALAADDLSGHIDLALWCRQQEAWNLLMRQCNYVLTLDPNNVQASLLLELAKSKLPAPSDAPAAGPTAGGAGPTGKPGLLTDEQVQVLRRKELKLNLRERVRVNFKNDALNRAWAMIAGREGWTDADRKGFNRLSPVEQAQFIISKLRMYERSVGDAPQADDPIMKDIEILNDPWLFAEYKRRVWPIVQNGCAASQCHGGAQAKGFTLFTDRVMTDNMHYTNYLILHEMKVGDQKVINRDFPDQSLLLTFGLPPVGNQPAGHPVAIPTVFRSPSDRKYEVIAGWIRTMGLPAPEYGISVADLK
jgi:hypothetical protein